ncbi:MAG: GNAT family N-acetyltransferase [Actinobacteria bacterium]|nr:MAG: GNAT family N-acetyltransferase [Actinomycetota bacterium]
MEIRPWRPGDQQLLIAAQRDLSRASLSSRFFVGTSTLPVKYLRYVAHAPRERWDAQVATHRGRLLGWAEFARLPARPDEADIAVLVIDAWQRQGVATALFRAMIPRAAAAGIRVAHADIEPGNRAARAMIAAVFGDTIRASFEDGLLHYKMPV